MSIIEKALEKLDHVEPRRSNPGLIQDRPTVTPITTPAPDVVDAPLADDPFDVHTTSLVEGPREIQPARKAELDLGKLKASHIITADTSDSQLAEEYRLIKRPLLMRASEGAHHVRNGNVIMVTSAVPGEGKTFSSINLAISMSMERDLNVLLVDADIAKSDITRVLGMDARTGLTDLLSSPGMNLDELVISTNIPNLNILPAGEERKNVTELLSSSAMTALVSELAARRNLIVIFDCPPMLAASGASVLLSLMGQAIVVVEAEKTMVKGIQEALQLLNGMENIGLVLNKSRARGSSKYYGYGNYGS